MVGAPPAQQVEQASGVSPVMDPVAGAAPTRLKDADRDRSEHAAPADQVPLWRLAALRAGYLFVAVGLAVTRWPLLVNHDQPWPLMDSVVVCMLVAMSILYFLGIRYPLQMLPMMLFESIWKLAWLGVVAVPLWAAGRMDAATWETAFACLLVVVVLLAVPWRYVFTHYVTRPGERWRRVRTHSGRQGSR